MTETDNDAPLAALALLEGKQLQSVSFRISANAVRPQLHVLAHNLGNFMRTLATPKVAEP